MSLEIICPLVSVIVQTKARINLLPETLKPVKSNVYANMEIVLINDGADDMKDLANSIAGNISHTYVYHETNLPALQQIMMYWQAR